MQEESHFLIVGLGLLGGSYAQGLKRKGFIQDVGGQGWDRRDRQPNDQRSLHAG